MDEGIAKYYRKFSTDAVYNKGWAAKILFSLRDVGYI